jgi:hypothetical protein
MGKAVETYGGRDNDVYTGRDNETYEVASSHPCPRPKSIKYIIALSC